MRKLMFPEDKKDIDEIIKKRNFVIDDDINKTVNKIIKEIKKNGDRALFDYTARFDKVELQQLKVVKKDIDYAYDNIVDSFIPALKEAIANISDYQSRLVEQSSFYYRGKNMIGQLVKPMQRIAAYIPGGRASYPSSALMTVIPALKAGVEEIVAVSPPDQKGSINPYTLVALNEIGVNEIYKIGGAQAIAALAWGTESIKPVDKIVGPGNIYVTVAKKMVFGQVDIDMLAGPSEILILADETAPLKYVAADLLSQAEHDPLAIPILITTCQKLFDDINDEVKKQLGELKKSDVARTSWQEKGLIIYIKEMKNGIELINKFAPEHLELMIAKPESYLGLIKNAGAIFIGQYSPEPLGDYMAGPNHVLPTGGTARFASPLTANDFIKRSSIINYQREGLAANEKTIRRLAELEGLTAHARAVKVRFEEENDEKTVKT